MKARPFAARTFFLVPFVPTGETAGGVYIPGHHRGIKAIYGRVTDVHPSCRNVRVGDWVVFAPERPIRLKWSGGVTYSLGEDQVLGVVEPGDGAPWFCEEEAA